jgi:hypothetical protein
MPLGYRLLACYDVAAKIMPTNFPHPLHTRRGWMLCPHCCADALTLRHTSALLELLACRNSHPTQCTGPGLDELVDCSSPTHAKLLGAVHLPTLSPGLLLLLLLLLLQATSKSEAYTVAT